MVLKELKPGNRGVIVGYSNAPAEYRRRLLTLGATPGTAFEVVRVAPLGDAVVLRVRHSLISESKHDAAERELGTN